MREEVWTRKFGARGDAAVRVVGIIVVAARRPVGKGGVIGGVIR
jgi:hypothetical protein